MSDLQLVDAQTINLSLLYNPFDKATSEQHDLVYQPGATLADYLQGLPTECEWMVFYNGFEVDLADANQITVQETDYLGLILIPQGGNTIKSILRIVIVAAATIAGYMIGGPIGAIVGAALASIATTILMAPKKPKSNPAESPSYGIDGAKNSATEGIPYPIVYGQFRVGGNYSDIYTENVGDDQYLYVRSVLSDGRVSAIEDIELNEQPVTNFQNVEVRTSLGSLNEPVNDWFRSSIRQVNKSMKIDTAWITHTTTAPVDKVRFDIGFTAGLVTVSKKKGTYSSNSVTFVAEYRPLDPVTKVPTGAWTTLPMGTPSTYRPTFGAPSQVQALLGRTTARISASAPLSKVASGTPGVVQYKAQSEPSWTTAGELGAEVTGLNLTGYSFEDVSGTIAGPTDITPQISGDFVVPLNGGETYDFRVLNGELNEIEADPTPTSNSVTITDSRTRQLRRSLESRVLPEGFYEVRIKRTTPTSTDQYIIDEVFLTDVAEIETDRVAMRGTANVSLRIKLTDQLNNIPGVTAKVTGGPIQQYDIDGNPTVEVTTANHAWVGLDMMLGAERGVGYGTDRIDWPRWLEFAEHCEEKNLTINRVFEETTNFGDAFNEVLRGAQAAPVPYGTKLSVVIDRPREPSAVFTQANINKGTFAVSYAPITDRANEFEVTYYDKNDRNRQKALRYVDPKVVSFSEIPRPAQIDLRGCDNIEMARTELWRAIYSNRYIIRSLSFEANIDAINVVIGDVCLIHHDQMEWADSGRLKSGSTASIIYLDQPVVKEVGQNYSVIVHFDAVSAGSRVVSSVVGSKILVSGASISGLGAQRVIVNGDDYEIVSLKDGGSFHTIQLASTPVGVSAGSVCEFWRTDALEERSVTSIAAAADGASIVTLATPLPAAPAQFSNFIYGRVENVIKPYALTGISGSGVDKRKLSFVEYNENVYLPPETVIPEPAALVNDRIVSHVETLLFDYERLAAPETTSINARLHWSPATIRNYGGADIYMALNGSAYRPVGSALNVSEFHIQLAPSDVVEFKAVAYSVRGDRAVFSTAPSVKGTISPSFATLDAPINLTSETTAFEINGTILLSWSPPVDAEGVTAYELEWKPDAEAEWNNVGVIRGLQFNLPAVGLGTFDYRVKSVGGSSFSLWSEDTHVVTAPALTDAVTNLKISNSAGLEFTGRDAQFSWTDNVRTQGFFLDYRVRILTIANAVIRTEYVSVPSYTYTYAKNVEDGTGSPRREFKIQVSQRGRQGQISTASTISVSNPAPAAPTVSATSTDRVVMLRFTPPVDPDYQSIKVWKGLVANVPEIAGNLIHDGVDTNVSFAVTPSTSYYIRYAAVDAFGISSIRGEGVVTADASSVVTWASIAGSPNAPADNATSGDNFIKNPVPFVDSSGWVLDRAIREIAAAGDPAAAYFKVAAAGTGGLTRTERMRCSSSKLFISSLYRSSVAGAQFQLSAWFFDATGAFLSNSLHNFFPAAANVWQRASSPVIDLPAGAAEFYIEIVGYGTGEWKWSAVYASTSQFGATDDRDRTLPNVLSIDEKIRIVIDRESARSDINGRYVTTRARLVALGLATTALDAASTNWLAYRNSISNWSNTAVASTINRSTWDNLSIAFDQQINVAQQAISEEDARRTATLQRGSSDLHNSNADFATGLQTPFTGYSTQTITLQPRADASGYLCRLSVAASVAGGLYFPNYAVAVPRGYRKIVVEFTPRSTIQASDWVVRLDQAGHGIVLNASLSTLTPNGETGPVAYLTSGRIYRYEVFVLITAATTDVTMFFYCFGSYGGVIDITDLGWRPAEQTETDFLTLRPAEAGATAGAVLGGNLLVTPGGAVIPAVDLQNSSYQFNADGTTSLLTGSGWVNVGFLDALLLPNGPLEADADRTITAQVTPSPPDDVTINATYTGTINFGANKVLTPSLMRNGVSVRDDNRASYSVTDISSGLTGFVTVNNTNGDANKGRITITNATATGLFRLNISWDSVLIASYLVRLTVVAAAPPTGGGGGGGGKSGTADVSGWGTTSASFTEVARVSNLTKATGETIKASLPVADYELSYNGNSTRHMVAKFQYSVAGANSWTDFGSGVSGSSSTFDATEFFATTGTITVNQNATPSDGDYDIRLVAAVNASGGGGLTFNSGEAMSVIIEP